MFAACCSHTEPPPRTWRRHIRIFIYTINGQVAPRLPELPRPGGQLPRRFLAIGSGSSIPDLTKVVGIEIECRWEQFFADTMALLAAELGYAFWVVDEMDIVWAGDAVDPRRVRL